MPYRGPESRDSGSNWPTDARKLVKRLRRVTKLPIALGFGISSAEQFAEVGQFADAVVVGSAIVETIERNRGREAKAVGEFVRGLLWKPSASGGCACETHLGVQMRPRAGESWIHGYRRLAKKIDELDQKLVALLSERARAAVEIGKLKRNTSMPIYEPDRERIVFENVQAVNPGPLPGRDLVRIYERIIDVMRNIQKEEIVPQPEAEETETELESEVND